MWFAGDGVDLLGRVGQCTGKCPAVCPELFKRLVIMPFAIAKPIAHAIKGEQRRQNQRRMSQRCIF